MEIEVSRETLMETESKMKERINDITGKLGVNFDKDSGDSGEQANAPEYLSQDNAQFSQITDFVNNLKMDTIQNDLNTGSYKPKKTKMISSNEE